MTIFIVDIPDALMDGISAARAAFNASLSELKDENGNAIDNPASYISDDDYFAARAIRMVQSWADGAGVPQVAQEKAKAEFLAKLPPEKRAAVGAAIRPPAREA
jgi:hypothetical protein